MIGLVCACRFRRHFVITLCISTHQFIRVHRVLITESCALVSLVESFIHRSCVVIVSLLPFVPCRLPVQPFHYCWLCSCTSRFEGSLMLLMHLLSPLWLPSTDRCTRLGRSTLPRTEVKETDRIFSRSSVCICVYVSVCVCVCVCVSTLALRTLESSRCPL
jgi:hypothetical protein